MSERLRSTVSLGLTVVLAIFLVAAVVTADPPAQDRVQSLGERIKCPVCQGESIADSPSGLARDMMGVVAELIGDGFSDQQVIDQILASYSGAQLLDPPRSGITLFLWLSPFAALLIGWPLVAGRRRRDPETPAATVPGRAREET